MQTFYTILNTENNRNLGYKYTYKLDALPDERLDHRRMMFNGHFCVCANNPTILNTLLLKLYLNKTRIVLDYGDVETGESWDEVYDVTGTIGRSTGQFPIPILVYNKRSYGGGSILDHCIISIKESKGAKILYQRVPKMKDDGNRI